MALSPPAGGPPAQKQGGHGKTKAPLESSRTLSRYQLATNTEGRCGDRLPPALSKEISECARALARNYAKVFKRDRRAKEQIIRLMRGLLPPRPRPRGRPRNPMVTRAIALYRRLRRESPESSPRQLWARVYPLVIPDWGTKREIEQRTARDELRERIAWRRRKRRPRKIRVPISTS